MAGERVARCEIYLTSAGLEPGSSNARFSLAKTTAHCLYPAGYFVVGIIGLSCVQLNSTS